MTGIHLIRLIPTACRTTTINRCPFSYIISNHYFQSSSNENSIKPTMIHRFCYFNNTSQVRSFAALRASSRSWSKRKGKKKEKKKSFNESKLDQQKRMKNLHVSCIFTLSTYLDDVLIILVVQIVFKTNLSPFFILSFQYSPLLK